MFELLKLIETLSSSLTADNIHEAVSLIEKLITLAETIAGSVTLEKK